MKKALFLSLFFVATAFFALEWDFRDGGLHDFRPANFLSYELVEGKGFLGIGKVNAYFSTPWPLDIPAQDFNFIEVSLDSDEARLVAYFSYDDNPMSEATRLETPIDSKRKKALIDLRKNPNWTGTIRAIRFDIVRTEGHTATVHSIRLLKDEPQVVDTGLIPNGDFASGKECWTTDAKITSNGAVLSPNQQLICDPVELTTLRKHLWIIQADHSLETVVEYQDIMGNTIGEEDPCSEAMAIIRPPRHAATLRLNIRNTGDSDAIVNQVSLESVPATISLQEAALYKKQGKKLTDIPGFNGIFRGKWIWMESLGEKLNQRAVFYKVISIDDMQKLANVKLHVTADNDCRVRVNDHAFQGPYHHNWSSADSFFIHDMLHNGSNLIALECFNEDGPGGIMADIILTYKDGTVVLIPTDETWSYDRIPNRQTPSNPPTLIQENGSSPWGEISHGEPSAIIARIEGLDIPQTADETTVWAPEPILHFSKEIIQNDDVEFSVRLQNGKADYLLLGTSLPLGELNGQESYALKLAPASFQFIPDGDYNVVVHMTDTTLEGVPAQTISVRRSANAPLGLPTARIVNQDCIPEVELNGTEKATITQYLVDMGLSDQHYREMKAAFDNGIPALWIHHIVEFDKDGNPDFTNIDNMCTTVLSRDPQLQITLITRLDCVGNPTMMPFFDKNPDALLMTYDGENGVKNYSDVPQKSPSMASEKWLAECDRILTLLVEHLKKMPYGQRVSAILPSSGVTWEWMYWGCQKEGEFVDYSIAFREAFVRFAKAKYGTIEKANLAWNKNFASFDEIITKNLLPTPQERKDLETNFALRLPAQAQYVMDFNRCMAVVTSDAIIRFCGTVKRASEGKLLAGAYYGYYREIVHSRWAQNSGHYALSRVLACPDVDFLHAPSSYGDRAPGSSGGIMIPVSSANLNKKVFVTESDIRTLYSQQPEFGMCDTLGSTKAVLIREAAMSFSQNVAMRYYDFSRGWVFGDPRLSDAAGAIRKAEEQLLAAHPKLLDPANAIAFVFNENAMEQLTYSSRLNIYGISFQYFQFPKTGVTFRAYMTPGLQDIPLEHKMWFFPNAFKLSSEDYDYLREKIIVPGNTVVFAIGTDVIGQDQFTTEHLTELTGMSFQIRKDTPLQGVPPALNATGMERLNSERFYSYQNPGDPFLPLFIPQDDNNTTILATDFQGTPVLAENTVNGCRVIFTTIPGIPAAWLRTLAIDAGLHCYDKTDGDITWAAGDFMGFHFPSAGTRTLYTPAQTCIVQDLLSGKEYSVTDGTFQYDAPAMSSALFLIKH